MTFKRMLPEFLSVALLGWAGLCAGDVTVSSDLTLSADTDWRGQGMVTVAQGVTVDLAGHTLTMDGLEGYGQIVNACAPDGYQLVESITSTGTQYIDLQLPGQTGLRAEADFSVVDDGGNYVMLGVEQRTKIIPLWISGGKWYAGYNGNVGGTTAYSSGTRVKATAVLKNGQQLVMGNGATLVSGSTSGSFAYSGTANSLYVFARHTAGDPTSYARATLYSLRLWQGDTLVRDLHPARRTADDVLGLVDFLDGTFYTNAGTGAFTAGTDIAAPSASAEATLSYSTTVAAATSGTVAFGTRINVIRRLVFPDGEPTPGDQIVSWSAIPADAANWVFESAPAGIEPVITTLGLYYGLGTNSTYSCTWKGGDGVFNAYTNWTKGADGEMTQFSGQMCYLPANDGRTDTFSYDGSGAMALTGTPLWVYGSYAFADAGGFYVSALTLFETARITYDPVSFTFRLKRPPCITAGAKFALPAKYAQATKGRFLLLTWDAGELDAETTAALATFFDTASTAATNPQVTAETVGDGGRLWLDLAPDAAHPRLNVFTSGDSITQGSDDSWGNWRTLLMKRLEAEGYDVMAKGHWKTGSADICQAAMPSNWVWHSGIGSEALITTSGRYGLCDCMENLLNTAGDLDVMLLLIGTNNLNHDNSLAADLYPHWTNLVSRMLAQKPHAKLIVGAVTNQGMWPTKEAQVQAFNTLMSNAVANAVFPAKRVYFADLHSATPRYDADGNYIDGSYLAADNVHPLWPSENKMAAVWCEAIQRAIADDPDWQSGVLEENPSTSGVETNVPAAYRAGFVRARTLDVAARNHTPFATLGYVPYDDFSASTAATQDISRVGYYLEIRPKNTEFNDYRGLVRYLWVDMDAFGDRTLDAVGVPYAQENVGRTTRVHVKTNMPGIEETLPTDDSRAAWIEFFPRNYSATAGTKTGAPAKVGPGRDWNDTPYGSAPGYGSMQVHRFTPGAYNPAEVLFAFNGWGTNTDTFGFDFGMGNLGIQMAGCLDWTLYSDGGANVPLYSVDSYEVARLEIWTKSFADDSDPYPPQVTLNSVSYADGTYAISGAYTAAGTGGSNVTVRIEWSTDAAFETIDGSQTLGAYTSASALSGSVGELDATVKRYFRLAAVNERGTTGYSAVSEMDPASAEAVTAVWTGAAGNGLATDAGNWSCLNAMNNTISGGLPGASTKIGSCALTCDSDWRGVTAEIDGTIDLKGHRLTVASLRGTGTITDSTLPAGYEKLEYIRATGTQYLDSGLAANATSGLTAEADFTVHKPSGNNVILGAYNGSYNCVLMWVSMNTWYMSYLTHIQGSAYGAEAKHHVCSTFKSGQQTCYVDGELMVNGTATGTIAWSRTLYILARNNNGGVNSQASASLYGMKIWSGSTLVRDYVPARRTSDNVAGLFDRVNLTFTVNKGTGTFTTGSVQEVGCAPGELHIAVPEGSVLENSSVSLTGHLKLVKDGAGTFIASKAGQDYFAGSQVAAGVMQFGGTSLQKLFGRAGTEIAVEADAELAFAGSTVAYPYSYVLNGGTLANAVYVGETPGIQTLRLTADSFARFDQVYNFLASGSARAQIDLAGHTLTLSGTDRWYNADVTGGTLRYLPGSLCHPKPRYTVNAKNVTLDMDGFLFLEGTAVMSVSNYLARCWMEKSSYNPEGTLNVYGTFTPTTNQYYGCVLQDGSKIDLSAWNGAWPTTSPTLSCETTKSTVTFADGAHIGLVLAGRAEHVSERIVSWTTAPTNIETLVFERVPFCSRGKLIVDEDGVYIYMAPTMIIIR